MIRKYTRLIPLVFTVILLLTIANTLIIYKHLTIVAILVEIFTVFFILFAAYLMRRDLQQRTELEHHKDEFISIASHELKTPITSLKVFNKLLQKKLENAPIAELHRYISKIDEQTSRLTSLVTNLLDLSRVQTGKMKIEKAPFDLNDLVKDTVDAVQETTKKHTIILKGKSKQVVTADRYRIYQVFVNLLTNAIKYSPDGKKIVVTVRDHEGKVQIQVRDFGIGIDNKNQKKIFERLFQVPSPDKKALPGLGMGLYITKEIIEKHGGKIWVESTKGRGSTFYVTLS